jgi:hypothetical protein
MITSMLSITGSHEYLFSYFYTLDEHSSIYYSYPCSSSLAKKVFEINQNMKELLLLAEEVVLPIQLLSCSSSSASNSS